MVAKKGTKQTLVYMNKKVLGWVEYKGLKDGGVSGYINRIVAEDRARALEEDGDDARKYRAYLVATDRDEELADANGEDTATSEEE